jgi:hypothetical protein
VAPVEVNVLGLIWSSLLRLLRLGSGGNAGQ